MDLLSRCSIEFDNVRGTRRKLTNLATLLETRPLSQRVIGLYTELRALDGILVERARRMAVGMQELEATGQGAEDLELDVELVAHLERRMVEMGAILARELDP
jgi:hypothetical protein